MARVSVLIPSRDGVDSLRETLRSLLSQQDVDVTVAVGVDASMDGTLEMLAEFPEVRYRLYPVREPKDYARVPLLINMILHLVPEDSDYYMVSGDDTTYPEDYIINVIFDMSKHKVDIGSGWSVQYMYRPTNAPGGSGRVFTKAAWALVTPYPESIIWETWALYKAMQHGMKMRMFDVKKSHNRPQGADSTRSFGHAAHMLGTPILFTVFRVLMDIRRGTQKPWPGVSILLGQLEYTLKMKPRHEDIVPFVRKLKYNQLWGNLRNLFIGRPVEFVRRALGQHAKNT